MDYTFKTDLAPAIFEQFSQTHPLASFFQSSYWPSVKDDWGVLFTGVYQQETLIAAGLVLIKQLPLGRTIFYLPRGPLIDFQDQALLRFYFTELKKVARKYKAVLIKIDPPLIHAIHPLSTKGKLTNNLSDKELVLLTRLGFKHHGFNLDMYATSQPRFTAIVDYQSVDLTYSKGFKDAQKAADKGIELVRLTYEELPIFAEIMKFTEERKEIYLRDLAYFKRLYQAFWPNVLVVATKLNLSQTIASQQAKLMVVQKKITQSQGTKQLRRLQEQEASYLKDLAFLTEKQASGPNEVYLSCLLAIKYQHSCEMLYAGVDTSYRQYLASYLSYARGIHWGKEQGCLSCNLGGIEGTLDDGLSIYKSFFQAEAVEYLGEFDLPVLKFWYYSIELFLPVYQALKRLRKIFQ